jgi:hypothetical protein
MRRQLPTVVAGGVSPVGRRPADRLAGSPVGVAVAVKLTTGIPVPAARAMTTKTTSGSVTSPEGDPPLRLVRPGIRGPRPQPRARTGPLMNLAAGPAVAGPARGALPRRLRTPRQITKRPLHDLLPQPR